MSLANAIRSAEDVSTERLTIMPRPGPVLRRGVSRSRKFSFVTASCMKRSARPSSRCWFASSGAMITNFDRSNPIWRSINGKVPRPIDPKPTITIGPSNRACSGQDSVTRVMAFISVIPNAVYEVRLHAAQANFLCDADPKPEHGPQKVGRQAREDRAWVQTDRLRAPGRALRRGRRLRAHGRAADAAHRGRAATRLA